jgi:hypothetical protein
MNLKRMRADRKSHDISNIRGYFEWSIAPFLSSFRDLAPAKHTEKLTLAHFLGNPDFECWLHVVDEVPHAGAITLIKANEPEHSSSSSPFPILRLSDVEVPYDDPTSIFNVIPKKVFCSK